MLRGQVWVIDGDEEAVVLVGSEHLSSATSPSPIVWGIPLTAEPQPRKFTEPFVVSLSPTQTQLEFPTWILVARGIQPLRKDNLAKRIGVLNAAALRRLNNAIRVLYDI